RCTESTSTPAISSASSIAFLIESTAASRFTTTPRRIPRDSATPRPTMSRPSPSSTSPPAAVTFDVPTSSPTRYLSFRATSPPAAVVCVPRRSAAPARRPALLLSAVGRRLRRTRRTRRLTPSKRGRRPRGPDVNPVLEPHIDVIDVFHAVAKRRGEIEVRLQTRQKPVLAELNHRRIAVQNYRRVVDVGHVHLRHPMRHSRLRLERCHHSRGQLGAARVDQRGVGDGGGTRVRAEPLCSRW